MQIALVLGLLALAIVLFSVDRLPVDLVTLLALLPLLFAGILTPSEAFAGFSSDFVITLAAIFVISGALQETGVLDKLGGYFARLGHLPPALITLCLMLFTSFISAFMNNTTVTALLVSPVLGMLRHTRTAASKLLMPLAFASILGGTCTLIGTSTNVAVSGYLAKTGLPPIAMFELLPVGLVLVGVGTAYMVLVGTRLLPAHPDDSLTDNYALRDYLTEIVVLPASPLIGQRVYASDLGQLDIRILQVIRREVSHFPHEEMQIAAGDLLLVEGKLDALLAVKNTNGIEIRADTLGDRELRQGNIQLAEVLLTPGSSLLGRTLKEADFRQRFGLVILAIYRSGQTLRDKISNIPFRLGDLLLVQGPESRLDILRASRDLAILGDFKPLAYRRNRGVATLALFGVGVVASTLNWVPVSVAFLTVAVGCVLIRAVAADRVYRLIEWRLLVLIGGMSTFGLAMEKTGASALLAQHVTALLQPYGTLAVLAGFVVLTVVLTQPMSNAAAALVVLPVAMQAAQQLHANPRTFAIGVMLAASVSVLTPFEPSCILVYGPGKYRFADFFRVGSGLTLLLILTLLLMIPVLWAL